MSLWDNLLASIAVETEYGIEDPQEAANALLPYLQDEIYTSPTAYNPQTNEVLQEAQDIAVSMQRVQALRKYAPVKRITTPTYRKYAPPGSAWKEQSYPIQYKADVNKRRGIIEAYLSVYDDPTTGLPFKDSYNDVIERGSFTKSIAKHEARRKRTNDPHLLPYLWQHERHEVLGGIKALTEDSKGVIYSAHLVPSVKRAQECMDLMEQHILGSSFGYDPNDFKYYGQVRHLKEIHLHEVSAVTFPANPHANVIGVKQASTFYVPSSYNVKPNPFAALDTWAASVRS